MAHWRDIKARAKSIVHKTFEYPAVYLTHAAGTPVPCHVRVHSKVSVTQNEFVWPQTSGYLEIDPRLIFDQREVSSIMPKAFVVLSQTQIYRVAVPGPFKDGFATVEVTPLSGSDLSTFAAQIDFTDPAYADLAG